MITNAEQYQKAQESLQLLEDRLHRLQQSERKVSRKPGFES